MNEKLARLRDSSKNYWGAMGKKQKIWLGATIGVLLLTIILLTSILSKTQYETVFQDLDTTDAQAIMNYLDTSKIAYKLENGGNAISVPSSDADRVRVAAGSQGLVQNGSIGFEAFNTGSSQFGMTDNEFNVKYRSALNGEVQQLLNGMQGVASSKVVVNLPKETAFAQEDETGASASIVMKFKPGFRPSQDEIDGYFNLVKTSVPNLKVGDITITSPQGELTASAKVGGVASSSGNANTQFQVQKKYEGDLKRNIVEFLGPMVGADNLVVSVLSSLNFDQVSREENVVKPLDDNNNNGIIISEQQMSESSEGSDNAAGGVAGTGETDVPGYSSTSGGGSSTSEKTSSTTNYEPSRFKNTVIGGPYAVKDLSISVGIPTTLLNQETKDQITQYLTSFVRSQLIESGQDVSNDAMIAKKVSVIGQNFAAAGTAGAAKGLTAGWIAAIGVAAAALIGGIILAVRRRRQAAAEELIEDLPQRVEYPSINLESVTNENQVRKNLETLAKRKPDDFVNLLRTWLVEE